MRRLSNISGLILIIVFIVKSLFDFLIYDPNSNSAPFYIWIIANAVYFIIPAIIIFIIGRFFKKTK